jgi:UBX domain-containing protein 7
MDDVGPGGGVMSMLSRGGHPYMDMNAMFEEQRATSAFARDAVNIAAAAANAAALDTSMGDGNDSVDDNTDGEEKEESKRKSPPSVAGLADMFAAPRHLMYTEGGFEGARTMAKDTKRWLLVNLQRDSEFSCHALNRDVWRDELVENLIREGFIFWQAVCSIFLFWFNAVVYYCPHIVFSNGSQMDISAEGSVYAQRYKVYDYPHIGIIDPRTRRLMWKKEGWTQQKPLTSEQFAEIAMDFCSRHSFDKPPQAPRPNSSAAARPTKRPMHEMSEEEQLQAAMRASLQESGEMVVDNDDDDDEEDYAIEEDDDDEDVVVIGVKGSDGEFKPSSTVAKPVENSTLPAAPSISENLLTVDIGVELDKGARIQFRLPDGMRKVRKFDPTSNVRLIYAFVAVSENAK